MRCLGTILAGALALVTTSPLHALQQQDSMSVRADMPSWESHLVIVPDSVERATFSNLAELLQARAPGLSVTRRGDGTTLIRWRGPTSVYADNAPLLIVDGIRIGLAQSHLEQFEGQPSPLDDVDVEQIERVEVVSPARDGALYGTGATNGVIRITTRQARATPTQWRVFTAAGGINEGTAYLGSFSRPGTMPNGEVTSVCTRRAEAQGYCVPTGPVTSINPLEEEGVIGTASLARFGGSISAGSELLAWTAGATFEREGSLIGAVARQRIHMRGHARAKLSASAELSLRGHWMEGSTPLTAQPFTSLRQQGLIIPSAQEQWTGFTTYPEPEHEQSRRGLSLSAEWRAREWLRGAVVAGLDHSSGRNDYTYTTTVNGYTSTFKSSTRQRRSDFTARADVVAEYRLGDVLAGRTTALVDLVEHRRRDRDDDWSTSDGLFSAASIRREDDKDVAAFAVSQELAAGNRALVRVGVRRDDAYYFGLRWKTPWYPHASFDWLATPDDDGAVGAVRLHVGFGKTGALPSIDHLLFRFLEPWEQPLERKAEATQAREAGIEGTFLRRRLDVSVTGYSHRTSDVLMDFFGHAGFGEVLNRGVETSIRIRVLDGARTGWNVRLGYAHNHNEVTRALGLTVSPSRQWVVEGQPVGAYGRYPVVSATDLDGDGVLDGCFPFESEGCEIVYAQQPTYHPAVPPTELSFENTMNFGPLRVTALLDHRRGHYLNNLTEAVRCRFSRCAEAYATSPSFDAEVRQAGAANTAQLMGAYVEKATFTKLRALSVSWDAPASWSRALHANNMQISIAGRNLVTWTDYTGMDPEASSYGDNSILVGDFAAAPLPRSVALRITVTQ